jgi:mono/diheme cytochrome c family protein
MKTIIGIAFLSLFTSVLVGMVRAQGEAQLSDPAAFYKAKCVACHGPKAEKRFDASLTDEQYLDAILKGKKPEKPPNMPAYGEKGVTAEQAKALLDHMKQLRSAQ